MQYETNDALLQPPHHGAVDLGRRGVLLRDEVEDIDRFLVEDRLRRACARADERSKGR